MPLLTDLALALYDKYLPAGQSKLPKQRFKELLREMLVTDEDDVLGFILQGFPEEVARKDLQVYVDEISAKLTLS